MHARDFEPMAECPLDDVRVLDLSRLVAGNILTHVLADLGAEVIKVEKPGRGDDLRNWQTGGVALWWQVYARNKKSLCLDLRRAAGRDLLLRLVETAQILVENYRPGTLEKMGLGPEVLHARNPKLVVVRVSGWGQSGPFRDKPGFGSLIEAFSGFAAMNGYADRPPVLPAFAMADAFAGLYGALAALTALRGRRAGRPGSGDRPCPARAAAGHARAQGRRAPADRRDHAAHGQPLHDPGAARRLSDQGRQIPGTLDRDPGDGGAPVPGDRPRRPARRSALSHQRSPARQPRRGRERRRGLHRRRAPRPKRSLFSSTPRSRSGRSATRPISRWIHMSPSARP